MTQGTIRIRGARQHNLKNLDLDIRTGEMTVVTGPSGSGKSSLVFDTLFAEGQRRYVETFSAYARQFLDRMDKPAVDKVEGVPPAIAIDQTNPVRSSRSTVGTMTELNDHLKLLYARAAQLFDKKTAQAVRHDTPESIYAELMARTAGSDSRVVMTFPVELPGNTSADEVTQWLSASGFTRVHAERDVATPAGPHKLLDVVADRFRVQTAEKARVIEAIELALKRGGRLNVYVQPAQEGAVEEMWRFSTGLHCPESDLRYADPTPSLFSFNSAMGACDTCRGFGRVIGVDYELVIPNDKLTLRSGAIKTLQTPAWAENQDDLMRHAEAAGIPRDTPWYKLTPAQQHWVIHGTPAYKEGQWKKQWYGIKRFFAYLESKAYKMHIRVLLSKYRSYTPCETCGGARLKLEALLWRLGSKEAADAALPPGKRFMPVGVDWTRAQLEALPGLSLHDLMQLPIDRLREFFNGLAPAALQDGGAPDAEFKALKSLFEEIHTRLKYLSDVGIGYLTLDRQSRTLSGGEVQRINLTTALGTSLVNTLFVLDEPSIGLHPRDMNRITQAMHRLRDAGNTLVVVEHDPAVMLAADRMIDMGPGPGEKGGQIVFDGTPEDLKHADTLTGAYLGSRKQVGMGFKRPVTDNTPRLILEGARDHNLKNLTVEFPLQRLVCVTGVSGSGKSTLMQDILAPALLRQFGKATETPGLHDRLMGADYLTDVVFVDQSPIGKTARSNPASYVGAWDAVRELFAQAPMARQRSYTASKFSFNNGDGRCPTCGGSGFEHVEMQFLSDVYLRCPDCDGKRYRPEILEVTIERKAIGDVRSRLMNVSDVLDLTVSEACALFAQDREVIRALQPIVDVGLEYVKLGQPVPTLSGGEAQRLKLAGFLAGASKTASNSRQPLALKNINRGTLFLFDEPTTGLHFDDIAKLMRALRKLLDVGHSLIIIEHNLDVIRSADWLIDLGPEGGEAGGLLVAQGTPEEVRQHPTSHTALALREYEQAMGKVHGVEEARPKAWSTRPAFSNLIQIVNAKEHNLKSLSVNIPRGQFNVVTGVSGSGKSTLAFDILFNEGQRRYLESLNAYARSIVQPAGRPEVDAVYGIPPTVAIEQRLSRGGRKSTVGTTTEVWHFLRLLYVKLGIQHCTKDGAAVMPQSAESIAAQLLKAHRGQHIGLLAPLVINRKGVYTELADWARPRGYTHLRVDGEFLPTTGFPRIDRFKEHTVELPIADIHVTPANEAALRLALATALEHGKGVVHVLAPLDGLHGAMLAGTSTRQIGALQASSTKRACPVCATSYPELDPRLFSYNSKHGWCPDCVGTGVRLTREQRKVFDDSVRDDDNKGREQSFVEADVDEVLDAVCPTCAGSRLNAQARAVKFAGVGIADIAALSVTDVRRWVEKLALSGREAGIARDLIPEIKSRLEFLEDVGLGYLTLDRGAPTLSGGEAQRIRLAAQLGSNLQGVCYVLDEPTIGLHPRDNQILLRALGKLSERGNTLVVVEHDEDTIRRADNIIDIGPGAGKRGGQLVGQGTAEHLATLPDSLTGRYLANPLIHPLQIRRETQLPLTPTLSPQGRGSNAGSSLPLPPGEGGGEGALPKPLSKAKAAALKAARLKAEAASASVAHNAAPAAVNPVTSWLGVVNADLHNLKNVSVQVPLYRLVAVTGVSGSGKSTLARDVLLANVQAGVAQRSTRAGREADDAGKHPAWTGCEYIEGYEVVDRVLEVDQTPIGKTPRSCPATYIGFWDTVRKLFADTLEARARGYGAGRFSFNTGEGRCPTCEGAGVRTIGMSFLPDVKVLCETCHGARFNPETQAVTWRGKNIGDVLTMEVDEAVGFFASMPNIAHPLQLLKDVGLGYLTLGQPSPTLSGGEAQRIKLVTELSRVRDDITRRGQKAPHTLYVLDEPTVGLHMADVEKLIHVLHRLVNGGHSVVVIEHDLDVIAEADWVIDLGPDGGNAGGQVVAATTPEQVVKLGTATGKALQGVLERH
ncbi:MULTISPECIES: excinuclease ABC subunit UvrA [unclassified Polaromonas]|jgi:excinuclease ABC subunit A|uniref:excinuclease ABC subunit UvrA n=1 Tax=unclassified Polaromonas TaxID=2638319 RepID=UPI000BD1B368|nr:MULTISPECIES: excinuclease ABC subunit UvrA [unclassified Polaromonas]OYY35763.1 MAG: excinuclease ABC subunit A [Polaromonas sp. 35-63-35]OYZ19932.1 MAG: excinuclease ABC subunit A [Polaromonas sp. 16-63-31]OYZ76808.1 MAG: excinuclease ABC subunit A [Polaromonas sp. 24-63-21]OZA51918.1 MAG: excinuclease ABC subunit A [Polaromonas sp. 17-63-33]OZA88051.1 MAG: excinuclease ABC subunit A [Polaromonas sp. 39-63-25]